MYGESPLCGRFIFLSREPAVLRTPRHRPCAHPALERGPGEFGGYRACGYGATAYLRGAKPNVRWPKSAKKCSAKLVGAAPRPTRPPAPRAGDLPEPSARPTRPTVRVLRPGTSRPCLAPWRATACADGHRTGCATRCTVRGSPGDLPRARHDTRAPATPAPRFSNFLDPTVPPPRVRTGTAPVAPCRPYHGVLADPLGARLGAVWRWRCSRTWWSRVSCARRAGTGARARLRGAGPRAVPGRTVCTALKSRPHSTGRGATPNVPNIRQPGTTPFARVARRTERADGSSLGPGGSHGTGAEAARHEEPVRTRPPAPHRAPARVARTEPSTPRPATTRPCTAPPHTRATVPRTRAGLARHERPARVGACTFGFPSVSCKPKLRLSDSKTSRSSVPVIATGASRGGDRPIGCARNAWKHTVRSHDTWFGRYAFGKVAPYVSLIQDYAKTCWLGGGSNLLGIITQERMDVERPSLMEGGPL